MNRSAAILLAAAMLTASNAAYGAAPPLQLIQPGDKSMSCEALAAEINTLSANKAKAAQRAETGRKARGLFSTALTVAAPMMGSAFASEGQSGLIAQQALGALQAQQVTAQMGQGLGAPEAVGASIEVQRMARLSDIYAAKGC